MYDGQPLTKDTYTVSGLPEGFTAEAVVEGTITDVGTVENKITSYIIYKSDDSEKKDVKDQFANVTTEDGELEVTKRKVTLTSETAEKEYDGTPLEKPEVTVGGDGFVEGEVTDIKATGSIVEVGSVTNTITYTEGAAFKAGNYEITKEEGKLTITQNTTELKVIAKSETKVYDGKPLTNDGYTLEGTLPEGHYEEVVVTGTITNVGTVDNVITSVIIRNADGKDVTSQFKSITTEDGTLEVTKRPITLTSGTASKAYDGTPLTKEEVTMEGELAEGDSISYKEFASQTYVGSKDNTFKYEITTAQSQPDAEPTFFKKLLNIFSFGLMAADDEPEAEEAATDPAGNYDITVNYGTLTVTEPKDDKDVITKTHKGEEFGVGDTVKFTIEVTNIYDEVKTITIEEIEGVTFTSDNVFKDVKPGETVTATAEYVLTEEDIYNGTFKNTATAKFSDEDRDYKGDDEVPTEKADPHLTVVKEVTNKPADGKKYEVGEKIEYKITVKNDGNLTIEDIEVADDLTGEKWTIDSLAPGKDKVFTTSYTVTEADGAAGKVTNVATAKGHNHFDDDETPNDPGKTETPTKSETPKTGDADDMRLWATMMAASLGCILLLFLKKRKNGKHYSR